MTSSVGRKSRDDLDLFAIVASDGERNQATRACLAHYRVLRKPSLRNSMCVGGGRDRIEPPRAG